MMNDREEGIIPRALPPGKAGKPLPSRTFSLRLLHHEAPHLGPRKANAMKRTMKLVLSLCAVASLALFSTGCAGYLADNPDLQLAADIALDYLKAAEGEQVKEACNSATKVSEEIGKGVEDVLKWKGELDSAIVQICTE